MRVAQYFLLAKKSTTAEDSDTSSASDNSMAQQHYNDLNTMADEALRNGTESIYKISNPASVLSVCAAVDLNSGTKVNFAIDGQDTITVDFGASNCLCNDNRYRRGKVIFIYSGLYRTIGSVITITTSNYFVNDNQVLGTKTITNIAPPTGINGRHSIVVTGTIIKANSGVQLPGILLVSVTGLAEILYKCGTMMFIILQELLMAQALLALHLQVQLLLL